MKYSLIFLLILTNFNCKVKCDQTTKSEQCECTFMNAFKNLQTKHKILTVFSIVLSNVLLSVCLTLAFKYFPFQFKLFQTTNQSRQQEQQKVKQESNLFSLFSIFNNKNQSSSVNKEQPIPTINIKTQQNNNLNDLESIEVVNEDDNQNK